MFPKDVMCAHKNWRMIADLMELWPRNVWEIGPGVHGNPTSILVLDAFPGYISDELKVKLARNNCKSVVISDGMTSQLWPHDISVNKQLKDLRKEHDTRLLSANLPPTSSVKIKRTFTSNLEGWVSAFWKNMVEEGVKHMFK